MRTNRKVYGSPPHVFYIPWLSIAFKSGGDGTAILAESPNSAKKAGVANKMARVIDSGWRMY
jgi:hypothetical protein